MNLIFIVSRCRRVYVATVGFRNKPKHRAESGLHRQHTGVAGFTLIELLAVVVIILILTGLVIRVAGYTQYRMAVSTTKAQLANIQAALEMYKADWGYYPRTGSVRLSTSGMQQGSNNWALLSALYPLNSVVYTNKNGYPDAVTISRAGRKTYLRFSAAQIRTNGATQYVDSNITELTNRQNNAVLNIYDAFGRPIVYYNSPQTPYANTGSSMSGGQVNPTTYDLFSFGPDGFTYCAPNWSGLWTNPAAATDDITGGSR